MFWKVFTKQIKLFTIYFFESFYLLFRLTFLKLDLFQKFRTFFKIAFFHQKLKLLSQLNCCYLNLVLKSLSANFPNNI
jgi:hypothetical protein